MDLQMKQWQKKQHESEQEIVHEQPQIQSSVSTSALPFFVPQVPNTKVSTLSVLSDSTFPRMMGSYLSFAQWQELELQALIFRYIMAGAAVPPHLLQPIKNSFLHCPLHPSLCWGRAALDPEPGRCRRTDGKKWRCSREVVAGQKYCERHMHRGRNRSRKPVEEQRGAIAIAGGSLAATSSPSLPPTPFDLLHLNERSNGTKNDSKSMSENQDHVDGGGRSDGRILRHFFDDWPRTLQEPDNGGSNASRNNSGTYLSISTPGNTSSDVSLKLSTGYEEDVCHVASMGGPLAEALGSSTSTSSPTSVLLQLPPSSASETSFIST